MSVSSVAEKTKPSHSLKKGGERTYTRTFQVVTSSTGDGPGIVRAGLGLGLGSPYIHGSEFDLGAVVVGIDPKPRKGKRSHWDVTVKYSTHPPQNNEDEDESPLDMTPQWSFRASRVPVAVTEDVNGVAMWNRALDPLPIDIERDEIRVILNYRRNQATFDLSQIVEYTDHINDGDFLGRPEKTVRVDEISVSSERTEKGIPYVVVNYAFEFARKPYNPTKFENVGTWELPDNFEDDPVKIKREGIPVTEPVFLNAAGKAFNEATDDQDEKFVEYDLYETADFSALGII